MHHNPSSTIDANADAGAYASFLIEGDAVLPGFWTEYFRVSPDLTIIKGQPFILPSGKTSKAMGKQGLWGLSSELAVQSDFFLDPHFRYLINRLGLPRDDLRQTLQQAGAKARFSCFWFNPFGNRIPDVAADIKEMTEAIGGTIDIDEYR